jgi:Mg2+ and Co2+ transporter CorA
MATMRSWIDHAGEVIWEPAPSLIAQFVEAGQPFWLDIENPTDELINQLASRLGLHLWRSRTQNSSASAQSCRSTATQSCSS